MATGGNRLEKNHSDLIPLTNPQGMQFPQNPIHVTVALFPAAHSQFSNHHNFITQKNSIGPDFKCRYCRQNFSIDRPDDKTLI
jgi:hypothetical protein